MGFIVMHSNNDMGDEGSYDGNVIGTFEDLVKDQELTEASALRWVDEELERMGLSVTPTITIKKHPHDSAYELLATVSHGFMELHYHFQAV